MSDYCHDCYGAMFGDPTRNDMRNLVPAGSCTAVLCECCGPVFVDHEGKRMEDSVIAPTCGCGVFSERETQLIVMAALKVMAHYAERDGYDTDALDQHMIRLKRVTEREQDAIGTILAELAGG